MRASPLRILHLVSSPFYSGALEVTCELAAAQREVGHRVCIAYDQQPPKNDYEEAAFLGVTRWGLDTVPLCPTTRRGWHAHWDDVFALRRLLAVEGFDVVHAHLNHDHALAWLAGAQRRSTLVRTLHSERSLRPRLGQWTLNGRCAALICRSASHRDTCASRLNNKVPVHLIPGGVDVARFRPPQPGERALARRALGLPPDAVIVLQAALLAGRGQAELVGALAHINEPLHIALAGRGENEGELRAQCARLGVRERVHFLGYLTGEALLAAYHAADAAFVGRMGNDASARGVLEAMATGVVVLASPHDAPGEAISGHRGYAVNDLTPEGVGEALRRWRDDSAKAQRPQVARAWVLQERTRTLEAEATLEVYQRTTYSSRGSALGNGMVM